MPVFDDIPLAKRGGPLVKVQIGPFTYQKMRLEDAIAAGLVAETPNERMSEQAKRREGEKAEETPLPGPPSRGEEIEEEPVVKRPKRRPQGRNKMVVQGEDK